MNSLFKNRLILGPCLLAAALIAFIHLTMPRNPTQDRDSATNLPDGKPDLLLWEDSKLRRKLAASQVSVISNILPQDYVGPEACKKCHEEKYDSWSKHPHRWMNAIASKNTVKGNFDNFSLPYLGGTVRQYTHNGEFRLELTRDDTKRTFKVTQTVGSRIFQFYVGILLEGPEPADHLAYDKEIILPSGWWITRNEWMPPTGVGFGDFNHDFVDPFESTVTLEYGQVCIECHTTIPFGEWALRSWVKGPQEYENYLFHEIKPYSFYVPEYISSAYSDKFKGSRSRKEFTMDHLLKLKSSEAADVAINLGISCEACHHGCAEHVRDKRIMPAFFPSGRSILTHEPTEYGRTPENKRVACSRCHDSLRPKYAAGMPIFNSAEYTEALAGSCYSKLTCVDCHNPHKATGVRWQHSSDEDDALCQKCHEIKTVKEIEAHTNHPADTEGSRCMNCHMPRIIEGLDKVTRTHAIFSPTNKEMLKAGHPNACNLCHLEKTIQWSIGHLIDWYGLEIPATPAGSPNRAEPAGSEWVKSEHHPTQLAATWAITSRKQFWALPDVLEMLDHSSVVFRHISSTGIEEMTGRKLSEKGYHFYQNQAERKRSLPVLREWLLKEFQTKKQARQNNED